MRTKSRRSKKSKGISWAQGDNLCQVKHFSSLDCPARVSDDRARPNDLPPGFKCDVSSRKSGLKPFYVAQIKWKSLSEFVLNHTWQVASGEESKEVKEQNSRQSRELEAIYPRFCSLPSSPAVNPKVEKENYDDSKTPVVPLIPIEEEESVDIQQCDISVPKITATSSQLQKQLKLPPQPPTDIGIDVANIASSALAEAIRTSNNEGSLIDTDLLIKILSDKNMVQKLILPPMTIPTVGNPRPTLQDTLPRFQAGLAPEPKPKPKPTSNFPRLSNGISYMVPSHVRPEFNGLSVGPPPSMTTLPVLPVKDANYYKNLIRQHGEQNMDNSVQAQNGQIRHNYFHHNHTHHEPNLVNNFKPVEMKTKFGKPCMFFNSSRGCMKGIECLFQHDVSVQCQARNVMESHHSAKRTKLST